MKSIGCPRCGMELPRRVVESGDYSFCSICGAELWVTGFPALFAAAADVTAARERGEGEAACFHHESRPAVHDCGRCGKFLCELCASVVGQEYLCPSCLVAGIQGGSDTRLQQERTLFDSIALTLGIAPIITVWFTGFGGAAAIYTALRYWKQPTSIVRRWGWRKYAAIVFGLGEIAIFVLLIAALIAQTQRAR